MFPGMNPREMQKAMKRLGIKQEEIEAELVIIKTKGNDIIVKNPQVSRVNMMGQETLQISGEITEQEVDSSPKISDEDVKMVIEQTGCTKFEAMDALTESRGDLAAAIMKLQEGRN
ncbi:MAG TPA: nascent polypeptide-associated complex protein [Candidatus Nanoarchaeia archaeon]|nr:nascent polypeptide-associated complex protein [Candidatus Nanoarchaeia archaeon]